MASKLPNTDAWLDRHQNMQHQQQGNAGKYGDGSPAQGGHGKNARSDSPRNHSSPRYHNKIAYLERHKDKRGSLHLAEEKVSQYLATGSIGEKAPPSYGDYQDMHSDSNHRYDSSSRMGETKEERDHRAEVQKTAVRVCGDWSEHISSSGKRYYYNCHTEVSQWEKPKEWNYSARRPDRSSRDGRGSIKSSSTSNVHGDERSRHSSTSDHRVDGRTRSLHVDSGYSGSYDRTVQKSSERHSVDSRESSISYDSAIARRNSSAETSHSHNHKTHTAQASHSGQSSNPDLKRNNVYAHSGDCGEPARQRQKQDNDNGHHPYRNTSHRGEDGNHQEDAVSPDSTPSRAQPSSSTAMQTIQELQKVLSLHIKKQQKKGNQQAASSSSGTTSAQLQSQLSNLHQNILQQQHQTPQNDAEATAASPHNAHSSLPGEEGRARNHDSSHHNNSNNNNSSNNNNNNNINNNNNNDQDGHESPVRGDMSPGSSCHSPTPSTSSSQTAPTLGTSALSVAALKSQQSASLSASLGNYYSEALIGHVLGWQAEQLEKQAERFRQEGLMVGSLHCSRVCTQLKRARSAVRNAEIQSTIQEQRVLMIQQHRGEIENLKPPTSLLPS